VGILRHTVHCGSVCEPFGPFDSNECWVQGLSCMKMRSPCVPDYAMLCSRRGGETSFLCALYRKQDNSERALSYRDAMSGPLHVTRLLLWEFRQSVRFQAYRHSKNRGAGFPLREAERMVEKLTEHLGLGVVKMADCNFTDILVTGERISKARTFAGGHRSFDILHIATAIELGAKEFLSFDVNQIQLASAEGLATPLDAA